ncbi:MAG: hypothetical protein C4306_11080 [Thermoleophilia bacterium]
MDGRRPGRGVVDTLAGLFASSALFFGLIALAYRPVPVSVAAILLSLVAAGMSERYRRLPPVSSICFVAGMAIAVVTGNPLW